MPLIHAEMAFLWARNSDNAAFKLRLKDDYGGLSAQCLPEHGCI
jgi:hypothetical protein